MKRLGAICVGICLILSFFLIRDNRVVASASDETIITEDIEVNAENKGLVLDVAENETVILRGIDFVYANDFSGVADTLINVQGGGKLVLEDVDFTLVNFEIGIYNEGEIIVDGVIFDNDTSATSIIHNNSTSETFKLYNGVISNIYLMYGNILVTESSREILGSNGTIKITLDDNSIGKRVVVGQNILAGYFLDNFEYVGSSQDMVLDYVGDNIADLVAKDDTITTLGLMPGDIVLTSAYSVVRHNGQNFYFANRYCTAREFIDNSQDYIPEELTEFAEYGNISFNVKNSVYSSGRYINNYETHIATSVILTREIDDDNFEYVYETNTSDVTINYIDQDDKILTEKTRNITTITNVGHAVFLTIPKGYTLEDIEYSSGISEVENLSNECPAYYRPIITCENGGEINVYVRKNAPAKLNKEILFESGILEEGVINITYNKQDYANLLNPYYMVDQTKNYLDFEITKDEQPVTEIVNVGSYTITFADTENINFINNSYTVIVNPKEVVIEYSNLNFTYSGSENTVTANILSGVVSGDAVNVSLENNSRTNVGSNVISATLDNENYYISADCLNKEIVVDKYIILESEIIFEDVSIDYDGGSHKLEAIIPNFIEVSYTTNEYKDAGTYDVTATFRFAENVDTNNYSELPFTTLTKKLTINRIAVPLGTLDLLERYEIEYDGTEKIIELSGELPETSEDLVEISYNYYDELSQKINGYPVNAGNYTVIVKFDVLNPKNYLPIADKEAELIVLQKEVKMLSVLFENKTVTFDNSPHTITVQNLPNEVEVSYSNNEGFVSVGDHYIVASFSIKDEFKTNYKLNSNDLTKTATLTINKANYDLNGIDFTAKTYTYDGFAKNIVIDENKLPSGLTVLSYTGNGKIDKGSYSVVIKFNNSNANYNDVEDKIISLIINARPITIEYTNSYTYTGSPITVEYSVSNVVSNDIVNVSLTNSTNTDANTYTCDVVLSGQDASNYIYDNSNKIRYEITKAVVDMSGVSIPSVIERFYDGKEFYPELSGSLPSVVGCAYTHTPIKNVGEYAVSITFTVNNPNYIVPDSMYSTVKIKPKDIAVEFTGWQNLIYDGNPKTLGIVFHGILENDFDDYEVVYTPTEVINVGHYTCTVYLSDYSNYNLVAPYSRNFVIKEDKKVFTSSDISLEITGNAFAPEAEFDVTTGVLDAKTTSLLKSVNSNVKFSNQLKIDLDTDIAVTVSLDAKFLDMSNADNIKIYRLKGEKLELVEFVLENDKIAFETMGNEVFILVQENESSSAMLYIIISILGVACIVSAITIVSLIRKKKLRK